MTAVDGTDGNMFTFTNLVHVDRTDLHGAGLPEQVAIPAQLGDPGAQGLWAANEFTTTVTTCPINRVIPRQQLQDQDADPDGWDDRPAAARL